VLIESTQVGASVVMKLIGRMDAPSATAFEEACAAWIAQGVVELVLDMTGLQYISSLGLRSFVVIGQQTKQNGGTLRLCGMTGLVKQVFDITRVASLFPMHDTVESALAGG
jgi:anti-anti-sigma factor